MSASGMALGLVRDGQALSPFKRRGYYSGGWSASRKLARPGPCQCHLRQRPWPCRDSLRVCTAATDESLGREATRLMSACEKSIGVRAGQEQEGTDDPMSDPKAKTVRTDVVLVGAGIMSATLGALLRLVEPDWSITLIERLDGAAAESSDPWNNAGTGHSALCELNYTPQNADGFGRHLQGRPRQRAVPGVAPVLGLRARRTACWVTCAASSTRFRTSASCTAPSNVRLPAGAASEALAANPLFASHGVHRRPGRVRPPAAADGRQARLLRSDRAELDPGGTDIDFGALSKQLIGYGGANGNDACSATRCAT